MKKNFPRHYKLIMDLFGPPCVWPTLHFSPNHHVLIWIIIEEVFVCDFRAKLT